MASQKPQASSSTHGDNAGPPRLRFEITYKNAMNKATLRTAAHLFSTHYGTWSASTAPSSDSGPASQHPPGSRITMDPGRFSHELWPAASCPSWTDLALIQTFPEDDPEDKEPLGQVIVTRWKWHDDDNDRDRDVLWITQLLVATPHRRRGIATALLREVAGESLLHPAVGGSATAAGGPSSQIVGVASANPATVCAVARVFGAGRTVTAVVQSRGGAVMMPKARAILAASPVGYLKRGRVRGRLADPDWAAAAGGDGDAAALVSVLDTGLYVDHAVPQEVLAEVKGKQGDWPLGELPEGCEWLLIFESD